ncbi:MULTISPECIES: hypothetical protein [Actinomycetes]|uniref:hypothetical protein n=1 Tax=Actinomycetes TaxID=1760 RepID=UPI00247932F0|nr:hypothetical protein [Amnibacterium kyonggiense]WDE72220.1 hypothetical protein [Amnibacterium kyonggiense]
MRVHVYDAGVQTPTTLTDVAPDVPAVEVLKVEIGEVIVTAAGVTEIDTTITIGEILGVAGGHVVKHPCRQVGVTVRYTSVQHTFELTPSTLLRTVLQDAVTQFGIDPDQAASLTLRQAGNAVTELSDVLPIGALTTECALVLDLGHIVRPQG